MEHLKYNDKKQLYSDNFSLGYINTNAGEKFVLISLICALTETLKSKKPGITIYQVLYKINTALQLPQEFIESLSIICEDFSYGCTEFPNFGVDQKDYIKTIKEILNKYIPF